MTRGQLLRNRLSDESGMALVIALGVAMVLAIAGTSLILYGTSNQNSANRSRATHDAYQLAVSGIENAVSQLAQADAGDSQVLDDYTLLPNTIGCAVPANCTQTFDAGESVTWSGYLCDLNPSGNGSSTCPTVYTSSPTNTYMPTLVWRLTSTSTVPSPNGGGSAITRTVTADARVVPEREIVPDTEAWNYVYSSSTGSVCDMTLENNPDITSSFYVEGNLCIQNNVQVLGPASASDPEVNVIVRGNLRQFNNNDWMGTNARPLTSLYVGGLCKYRSLPWFATCTDGSPATENDYHARPESQTAPAAIARPTADWETWYYNSAPGPGVGNGCDPELSSGSYPDFSDTNSLIDGSKPTLNFTSLSSFSCKTLLGELTWDDATNRLTIAGTVFWDGPIEFRDPLAQLDIDYDGAAALYAGGTVKFHQASLCADFVSSGDDCDFAGWDPETDILMIAALGQFPSSECTTCSISLDTSSQFQGALYSDINIEFKNNSFMQGPMVADLENISNNFQFEYIPIPINVPFGTPNITIKDWDLLSPTNFAG